ncbi:MAG: DNA polymerase III subunit chi [Pseudomonadota bacterium]
MTEVRFYHLQKQNLDEALPLILEKAYASGHRTIVRMASEDEAERMAGHLWSFRQQSFIPHGTKKDGNAAMQPIWITDDGEENPNNAKTLILTQGRTQDDISSFELCCEMLDGRNDNQVSEARKRWKEYQSKGYDVTYWHQSEEGTWEKK